MQLPPHSPPSLPPTAQDLLATALVPVCFRLLEYAIEVNEAVGVLVIILSHMLYDVFNFAFVLLLSALGVGATLQNVIDAHRIHTSHDPSLPKPDDALPPRPISPATTSYLARRYLCMTCACTCTCTCTR